MNKQNKKETKYDRFLNWLHTDRPWDAPIVVGGEMIFLAIALFYKFFFDSTLGAILRIEHYFLFLFIIAGIGCVFIVGVVALICGFVIRFNYKNRKK